MGISDWSSDVCSSDLQDDEKLRGRTRSDEVFFSLDDPVAAIAMCFRVELTDIASVIGFGKRVRGQQAFRESGKIPLLETVHGEQAHHCLGLVDRNERYADRRAGGAQLLEYGHRVRVGQPADRKRT